MSLRLDNPTAANAQPSLGSDVSDLLEVLSDIQTHLADLVRSASEKLDALRGAHTEALEATASEEHRLLRLLFECGERKDALVARFAQRLKFQIINSQFNCSGGDERES